MHRLLVSLVIFSLALAGCGGPAPLRPASGGNANPLVVLADAPGIEVEPVDGPALPMARLLAGSVAEGLIKLDIPASAGAAGGGRYILRGRAQPLPGEGGHGFRVVIHWILMERGGGTVGGFTQRVPASRFEWEFGDPRVIRAVGTAAAAPVAAMLRDDSGERMGPPPVAAPARPAPLPVLLVAPVEGAPGDGNRALGHAMRAALGDAGVAVTGDARRAGLVLRGRVRIEPGGATDRVSIEWIVSWRRGGEVGRATQNNSLPRGSLDGRWGGIASEAAIAAAGTIGRLVEIGARRAKAAGQPLRGAGPGGPGAASSAPLQRISGRAPPLP